MKEEKEFNFRVQQPFLLAVNSKDLPNGPFMPSLVFDIIMRARGAGPVLSLLRLKVVKKNGHASIQYTIIQLYRKVDELS